MKKILLLLCVATTNFAYDITVINTTKVDIAMRPVTTTSCSSEPYEVIRAGETKTPWHVGCGYSNFHIDISDEWDANKSWIGAARNKNRSWGYSYENISILTTSEARTTTVKSIIFIWDEPLNAPRPYIKADTTTTDKYTNKSQVTTQNITIELR